MGKHQKQPFSLLRSFFLDPAHSLARENYELLLACDLEPFTRKEELFFSQDKKHG